MRTLRFFVDGQTIKPDPTCDFSGLFLSKNSDVCAEFIFSSEWNGMTKVAAFWSMLNEEYEPQVIDENNTCIIPSEAFTRAAFKIQALGIKGSGKLTTNKLVVLQTGGRR
jgi:hypothetical protein